ncbi:hypothetical protein BU25DRAFT_426679 [Macroventuria anomochaeta]|uniref:Uncharacterized protein n=1 Tax=Macroventuria anomochaeta TaxID=301207 RepID=A0ACB6RJJ7_9PLEO|nr:uncharacterized protein BU25DRAFT_426679 [Macroventuria anomochaeta]KAF2621157.1 hypothetical protein BU25DRAFT_426679 [Macroventuria anomochaeta]
MSSLYTPGQIDDANLNYHYRVVFDDARGIYYQLATGALGFPQGFWIPSVSSEPASSSAVPAPSSYRTKVVSTFRIVAHTMGPLAPGASISQNHWTIYLLVQGGSVQLNMKTNTDLHSRRGIFLVKEHAYSESNMAVCFFDFPAAPSVTVGWVESEIR